MQQEIKERIDMISRGEIPLGYKKINFGVIPGDWNIVELETFIETLEAGVSVNSYDFPAQNEQYGILKTSAVYNGTFYPNENKLIDDNELIRAKIKPKKESVIISRMNTPDLVGEVGYVDRDYDRLFLPDRLWQTKYKKPTSGRWLANLLTINKIKYQIKNIATGTSNSMKNISKESFLSLFVPYPEYIEQQKIAAILSTWDKAIELKEKLIAQKQKLKKGLLQRLLVGKVRVPGFSEEWKEVKLGDILKERNETGFNNLELLSITSKNGVIKRTEIDGKDNSSEDKSKYKRILPLDIGYNTMRMWQGVSGVSEYEGIVSPAYTVLVPKSTIDSYFIGYLFKHPKIINLFYRLSQGLVNDTLNLKYENLKQIKIKIPKDIIEQRKIAEILSVIDKEIMINEEELALLKQQKKGLMQLLLTGIVRVKY